MWAHVRDKPPAVTDLRPDVPQGLNRVLAKALSKAPEFRYQTAGELATAARAVVGSGGDERSLDQPPPERPSAVRGALLGAGIAAALVVGLVVFLLAGHGSAPRAEPSAPSTPSVATSATIPSATTPPEDLVTGTGLFRLDPQTGKPSGRIAPSVFDPGAIDGLAVGEGGLWVHVGSEGEVAEIKPKTKAVAAIVPVDPSGYVFTGQGAVWIGSGDRVLRVDPVDGRIAATIAYPAHPSGPLSSATRDLVWADGPAMSKKPGLPNSGRSLLGIDTRTNEVVVAIALPSWSGMCLLSGALWVAEPVGPNLGPPRLLRLDPKLQPPVRVPESKRDPAVLDALGLVFEESLGPAIPPVGHGREALLPVLDGEPPHGHDRRSMPLSGLEVAGERRFVSPDRLVEAAGGVGGLAERIEIVGAERSLRASRGEGVVCLAPSAAEERLPASLEQRPRSLLRVHCLLILAHMTMAGGWNSNPGGTRSPSGFQDRRLRPLGHPPAGLSHGFRRADPLLDYRLYKEVFPTWALARRIVGIRIGPTAGRAACGRCPGGGPSSSAGWRLLLGTHRNIAHGSAQHAPHAGTRRTHAGGSLAWRPDLGPLLHVGVHSLSRLLGSAAALDG